MKKSRLGDNQIMTAIKLVEVDLPAPEICRELGISAAERMKARLLAEVECIIGIIKCQFGFTKFRYRGYKNATQIMIQSPPSISGRHYERCRKGRRR